VTAKGEAPWLFCYAIASFFYRLFISVAIALLIGSSFFIVGVLIAIWSLVLMIGVPLFKSVRFLFVSPALRRSRGRAMAVTGGTLAALGGVLFALPLPHATMAEGVVWVRGEAAIHAGAEGVVTSLAAAPNAVVEPGVAILQLEDPALAARVRLLAGRVAELEAHHAMRDLSDPVRAKITLEELGLARADLALARERLAQLVLRSKAEGRLSLTRPDDLVGRFIRKGDLIGYILRQDDPVIRVVIPESEADLVLQRTRDVALRTASDRATVLPARIERIVPGLQDSLPSPALGTQGGGSISLDPTDPGRARTLGRFLQIDLALPEGAAEGTRFGERVHVRFAHGAEPIANRAWRGLRQVFLKHFGI
jgi:putative peptide zinc metalloprotease protein